MRLNPDFIPGRVKGKQLSKGTLAQELLTKAVKFAILARPDYILFVKRS